MFGIPNVGSNLCGATFAKDEKAIDELCLRSYALSVISPIAIFNNDATDATKIPFTLTTSANIASVLNQRMQFMAYMRT